MSNELALQHENALQLCDVMLEETRRPIPSFFTRARVVLARRCGSQWRR